MDNEQKPRNESERDQQKPRHKEEKPQTWKHPDDGTELSELSERDQERPLKP